VEVELDEGKRRLVVRTVSGIKEEFPWVWLRLLYITHKLNLSLQYEVFYKLISYIRT
jgi:hypothetical protein